MDLLKDPGYMNREYSLCNFKLIKYKNKADPYKERGLIRWRDKQLFIGK